MISNNIKNIFSFLEFLHLNIEHFNNQKPLLDEISQVRKEYYDLDPKINYQHTFLRKVLREKEDKLEERFYNECRKAIREKAIELNIIDLNDRFGSGFIHIGEFLILVTTQDYDRNDVEIILRAKDNYISLMTSIKVNLDSFLTYGIIRDFKNDLFDCFTPFLTDSDKEILAKFKSFDEFLEFCKPQLTGFKHNSEIQKSIDNLNRALYTTNEENAIDLLISNVEKFKSDNENSIKKYFKDNNVQMFLNNTEKITDNKLLEELSLYFQFSDLLLNARNKLETIPLLKEIENRRNVKDLPPQQKQESEPQISNVSNDIESAFSFMQQNDPRKHKRIISDDDFDSLMKWITYYFENNFTIPEIDNPIKVINTNKGNVVYTFIKIFKELHPTKTRPDSLFELIKLCFYDYRNDNISNYKKQKEPQFYSQLINKK